MSNKKVRFKPIPPEISSITQQYRNRPDSILEILKDLQQEQGGLTTTAIADLARALKIPASKINSVATFYSMLSFAPKSNGTVRICDGPVCWLCHSNEIRESFKAASRDEKGWKIERTSCLGLCDRAPAALIDDRQAGPVQPEDLPRLTKGWFGSKTDYSEPRRGELRVMLANAGKIDPESLDSAIAFGVYGALKKALTQSPKTILAEVEQSGLMGRGGAGFPVGRKWLFVAQANRGPKYVICNADESEPLIFKDRVLIETNPHQILEGMAIAGYATGAEEAFIYIRGEYEAQASLLERAITQAESAGLLGNHILGTENSFRIHVHRGAGAYICGEETALIESLEGKRGEPRLRPPYPPSNGYHGLPTLVNNVESYAAVPAIIDHGADWYRSLSGYHSPGTKIYMILGHINQPGLFEAPYGITVREAIEEFGGGMRPGSKFHFALTGGAAGTIIPEELLDTPLDYSSAAQGVSIGAGAFLICDQTISPVEILRELLHFFSVESCGKCTPCRVGTQRGYEILGNMTSKLGSKEDIEELTRLADYLQEASFCGLGQSVAIPMRSALKNFAGDFH